MSKGGSGRFKYESVGRGGGTGAKIATSTSSTGRKDTFVSVGGVLRNTRFMSSSQKKSVLGYQPARSGGAAKAPGGSGGGSGRGNPHHDERGRFSS